jgi:hypothetical protein
MKYRKMTYSLKRYLRRIKAEIRKNERDLAKQAELVKILYKSIYGED